MTISKKFPQFQGEKVLILATGMEAASIYLAEDGVIQMIERFQTAWPVYSDSESFFGRSKNMSVGSVVKDPKKIAYRDFMRDLKVRLKKMGDEHEITKVFIFTPKALKNRVFETLPSKMRSLVSHEIIGNLADFHPFVLLGRIQRAEGPKESRTVIPNKAKRLLERPENPVPERRHWRKKLGA